MDAYWTDEFANLLTISIVSKQDMLMEAEKLLARTNTIMRQITNSRSPI